MNERQLRSFISAADCGSFSKAAMKDYISVQALVQQINLLEQSLRFSLFERGSKGVTLTEAGRMFYDIAKDILDKYDAALQQGRELEDPPHATVRIACDPSGAAPFLVPICDKLKTCRPPVIPQFVEVPCALMPESLKDDEFDICFYPESMRFADLCIEFEQIGEEQIICAIAPGNPLTTATLIHAEDLDKQQLYVEHTDDVRVHELLDRLADGGYAPILHVVPWSSSLPVEVALNDGILLELANYTSDCVPPLIAVPLDCAPTAYGIAYSPRVKKRLGDTLQQVIDITRECLGDKSATDEQQ